MSTPPAHIFFILFCLLVGPGPLAGIGTAKADSAGIGESITGDLQWGENLSLDGYYLLAADFSREADNPSVLLELFRGHERIKAQPLHQGESFAFNDTGEVNVEAIFMPGRSEEEEEPSATVKLALYAAPSIQLHLTSDKDSYDPGEDIRLKLIAENEGTRDAEGIRINLSSQPGFFHFSDGISILEAGNSTEVGEGGAQKWIRFKAPLLPGPHRILLQAAARYSDSNWTERVAHGYCVIDVSGQISLHKSVPAEMIPGNKYQAILTLRNSGRENVSVALEDFISAGFGTGPEFALSWKLELGPGRMETVSYDLIPRKPGMGQALPAAIASYVIGNESYESRSESLSTDVSGPYLEVEKEVSPSRVHIGEAVGVNVHIINQGNRTVKASFNETVPDGVTFLGGDTRYSGILKSAKGAMISYRLSCSAPGSYEIPQTVVFYSDSRGDQYSVSSSSGRLQVEEDPSIGVNASIEGKNNSAGPDLSFIRTSKADSTGSGDPADPTDLGDFGSADRFRRSAYLPILFASVILLFYLLFCRII